MSKGVTSKGDLGDVQDELAEAVEEAIEETARATHAQIQRSFENEQTPMGTPWKPLSEKTLAYSKHDPSEKSILVEEGDLRESFESEIESDTGVSTTLTIESDDPKLPYHEFGTEDIPRRPILDPLADWWYHHAVEEVFADTLEAEIDGVVM